MHAVSVGLANLMHYGGEVALVPVCYPLCLGNTGLGVASEGLSREPSVSAGSLVTATRFAVGLRQARGLFRGLNEASEPVLLALGMGSS